MNELNPQSGRKQTQSSHAERQASGMEETTDIRRNVLTNKYQPIYELAWGRSSVVVRRPCIPEAPSPHRQGD